MSCFFLQPDQLILKLIWNNQHVSIARKTLKRKRCDGGLGPMEFQASMMWSQSRDRKTTEQNRMSRTDQTHTETEHIIKTSTSDQWAKTQIKFVLGQLNSLLIKDKIRPILYIRINSK